MISVYPESGSENAGVCYLRRIYLGLSVLCEVDIIRDYSYTYTYL